MLGAGTFGYKVHYDQQIMEQTLIVEKKVQEKVQQQIQEATFVLSNPMPTVALALPEEKLPYHLVAGAYRSEENANKAIAELVASGFEQAKMLPLNKHDLYPVVFASFKTLKEAQAERKAIQKSHNAEAWLLID
jgi:cell division protein FtsN